MTHGHCDYCARTKRLDQHGRIAVHYLTIPVSARRSGPSAPAGCGEGAAGRAVHRGRPAGEPSPGPSVTMRR